MLVQNGAVCSVDASVCSPFFCDARTWKSEHHFYEVNEFGSECEDGWNLLLLFSSIVRAPLRS